MSSNPSYSDPRLVAAFRWFAALVAALCALGGAAALAAWAAGRGAATALLPGQPPLEPLTALGLLLAGAALWLLLPPPASAHSAATTAAGASGLVGRRLGLICAGAAAALGGLVLLEYALKVDLPQVDGALFSTALLAGHAAHPGRPGPAAAANLLLIGLALLALRPAVARRVPRWLPSVGLALGLLLSSLVLLSFIYEASAIGQAAPYLPAESSSALAYGLLALGVLAAAPAGPLISMLTSTMAGGALSRRLLPAAILLPFVLGWVRVIGLQRGVVDIGFAGAAYAASNIVVFCALVFWTAHQANQSEARRTVVYDALRVSEERLRADAAERQRTEAALRQSEERFEKAFRASPAGVSVTRVSDGVFVDVNDSLAELLGYTRDELIGQTARGLGIQTDWEARSRLMDHLESVRLIRNREISLRAKNGEARHMLFSMDAIELGGEPHLLTIWIDNTERRRAAEALHQLNAELEARVLARTAELAANEAKLRALFDVLPVGVSILDPQRRVVQANPALGHIMRLTPESLASGAFARRRVLRPDGSDMPPDEYASAVALREQRPVTHAEMGVIVESGDTLWVDVSAAPLPAPDAGVVVVTTDVTERKRTEAALQAGQQRNRELFEAERRQAQELTLRDLMHTALARELPLPEIARILVDGIAHTIGYSQVSLYLLQGDTLRLQHQVGYHQVIESVPISQGVSGRVVRTRQAVLVEDVRADPDFMGAIDGIVSEVCVPLFDQGQVAGVLNLESAQGARLTEADLRLMVALGAQVDFALGRARLAAEARESQQRFASAFNHATIGMTLVSPQGRFLQVNRSLCQLVGYTAEELVAISFQDITHPDDLETDLLLLRQVLSGARQSYQMEKRYYHHDRHIVWVLLTVSLVRDAAGQPLYFISQIEDITERKAAEEALAAQAQVLATERDLMRALMDSIPDTIYFKDTASRFTRVNRAQAEYLRLPSPEAALGKTDLDLQETGLARDIFEEEQRVVLQGRPLLNRIDRVSAPNGQPRWISSTKVPLRDADGRVTGLVGISRDITALKQAEAQLLASLQEKEVLLKEIHHRVKNNLQVVSSLLRLQAETIADPELRDAFEDSQRRVRAMALVHELLYRSADLAHIDFGEYLTGLVNYLRRSHARPLHNLRLRVEVAAITLEIDQAIPLGLLVNELVTNSLKYAFPDLQPEAEIWVTASCDAAGTLVLAVGDNGVGLPATVNVEDPASMGWQLVQSFVAQLHGRYTLTRQPGAVFTLTIPERKDPRG